MLVKMSRKFHAFGSAKISKPKDTRWQQFSRKIKSPCIVFFSTTHVCFDLFNIQHAGTRRRSAFIMIADQVLSIYPWPGFNLNLASLGPERTTTIYFLFFTQPYKSHSE